MAEVKSYKVLSLPSNPTPDSIYWVKGSSASDVVGYITDRQGVPYPLKDLQGSGGITTLVNTDGNLVITGADNKVINLAPALLSVINSALQSGDNISELTNDAGYITSADLPTKTSDLINDGSDATSTYVEADELGAVAFSNDYNDLDNKPTIPTVITNHSGLSLDDGTNPHGTAKGDVGLGNVPNIDTSTTSNVSEGSNLYFTTARVLATVLSGLSLATGGAIVSTDSILVAFGKIQKQIDDLTTSIGNKLDKVSTSGVERAYIINADGSQGTKATSDLKDVLEFANLASFPVTGETGKIYVALDTNKTYRWGGSVYVQIGGKKRVVICDLGRFQIKVTAVNNFVCNVPFPSYFYPNGATGVSNHLLLLPSTQSVIYKVPFDCSLEEICISTATNFDGNISIWKTAPNSYNSTPIELFYVEDDTNTAYKKFTIDSPKILKDSFIHIFFARRVYTSSWYSGAFLRFKEI